MSATRDAAGSPFDYDREVTYSVDGTEFSASIHYIDAPQENPSFVGVLQHTFFRDESHNFPSSSFDRRADWHRNTAPFYAWVRCHMLRLAWDCGEKHLARFLHAHPEVCESFGFEVEHDRDLSGAPSQSRLWEMWNEEFTDEHRAFVREATEEALELARDLGIPAPDPVFRPEDRAISSESGEQKLLAEKTKEVWQQAKPFVTDTFYLDRADNAQIHENAFWEQHSYMGMREDMYAQSGQHSFYIDSDRDRTPSASNHRYQLQKHSIEDVRSMLQETTRALIARARHNSELVGSLTAAIDITKGNPFTGEAGRNEDGRLTDEWILGYKDGEVYYQWATIQIVGLDIPLVLDAVPVHRGMSRDAIVDELLDSATGLVDDLDLVMMDREFDTDDVKDACARHGVYYLNPARKHQSERGTCTEMRKAGQRVKVEEQNSLFGHSRKRVFLPARNASLFGGEDAEEDEQQAREQEQERREEFRQGLLDDLEDVGADTSGLDASSPFSGIIDEVRADEEDGRGNDEDVAAYALFETNHPALQTDAPTEDALLSEVRGFIARYRHRWGIENGYKKLKKFRVRTTSKDPQYRFFNFAFACVLYNVWRLVDLLVKLAIEDDPEYAPRVDANQFLTVAKQYYGLDPPD